MNSIIVKRSKSNLIAYPQVEGYDIKRALTTKEAMTKQAKNATDCVIIEEAQEEDALTIETQILTGTVVKETTLICLLTQSDSSISVETMDKLRSRLDNPRQLVMLDSYNSESTYEEILSTLKGLYDGMLTAQDIVSIPDNIQAEPEEQKSAKADFEEKTMLGEMSLNELKVDSEKLISLEQNLRSVTKELQLAKDFINKITNNPVVTQMTVGGAEAARLYEKNDELQAEVDRLKKAGEQLEKLKAENAELSTIIEAERAVTKAYRQLISSIYDYGIIQQKENRRYEKEKTDAENEAIRLNRTIEKLHEDLKGKDDDIAALQETNSEQDETIKELRLDLNTAVETAKADKIKVQELDATISRLTDERNRAVLSLNQAQQELSKLNTYDINHLREMASHGGNVQELLESKLREAREAQKNVEEKNKALAKEIANVRATAEKLSTEKKVLESLLDGENISAQGIQWIYHLTQSRMLTFIGHGGQGCTSVAAAVAERLFDCGKSVVIIDADFRAPRMHALFKVSPILEFTRFTTLQSNMKTSLGKYLALGAAALQHLQDELLINIKKSKTNTLDLMSGLIEVRSNSEIAGLDFSSLCVQLAEKYDYIIVDLGRCEGMGGISRQQSAFMAEANRKFVVTSNSVDSVKSIFTRLIQARVDMNSVELIFDMLQAKSDPGIKALIDRAKRVYEIPIDKGMLAQCKSLGSSNAVIKKIVADELGTDLRK